MLEEEVIHLRLCLMDSFKDSKKQVGELVLIKKPSQKDFYFMVVMLHLMVNNMDQILLIPNGLIMVVHVD